MQETDYSKYIIGKSIIDHRERISLGFTNDEYIFFHAARPDKTFTDYWKECGLYPSEVRKLISQLKAKGVNFKIPVPTKLKSPAKERRIYFNESDIYEKKLFAEKFKWPKDKLEYYWNAADEWSCNGGKKVNWYQTIANWERRDTREGKLKFADKSTETQANFFENR